MSSPPDESACSILEPQRLIQITTGDQNLIERILANFCADIQRQYQSLRDCCKAGSVEQQYIVLHKMKGSVGNIGGKRLEQLLADCGDRTRQGRMAIRDEDVQHIGRELDELLNDIEKTDWAAD